MSVQKQNLRSLSILPCAAFAGWASLAEAETVELYLTEGKIVPRKIEVREGDSIVIHNSSRVRHSLQITGHVHRFGRKHFVHDLSLHPDRSHVLAIDRRILKPASYNIGCSIHNRMKGTIVIRQTGTEPTALREGERRRTAH